MGVSENAGSEALVPNNTPIAAKFINCQIIYQVDFIFPPPNTELNPNHSPRRKFPLFFEMHIQTDASLQHLGGISRHLERLSEHHKISILLT